jgi:hypothetical protein
MSDVLAEMGRIRKDRDKLREENAKLLEAVELAKKAIPDFGGGRAAERFRLAYAQIGPDQQTSAIIGSIGPASSEEAAQWSELVANTLHRNPV